MKLGMRRALLMGLAMLGVFIVEAVPAGATANVNVGIGLVQGGGIITPGLHATPARQAFTFNSVTITTVGIGHGKQPTVAGTSTCTAGGNDGIYVPVAKVESGVYPGDSLAFGTGLGNWACGSGPLANKGGLLYYTRVGPIVTVVLTKHGGPLGKDVPVGGLVCVFIANQTPPALVTSYTLTCVGGLADALGLP